MHVHAIRAYTNKIRTKILSTTCEYIPNTYTFFKDPKSTYTFFDVHIASICTYFLKNIFGLDKIRAYTTKVVYERICMYMHVYVRIQCMRY